MTRFYPYVSFLIYKVLSGGLFAITVYFFVDDQTISKYYPIIIIQEFYFSYFYTLKKTQLINLNKITNYSAQFLFLSFLVIVGVTIIEEVNEKLFYFLCLSMIFFSVYASNAPLVEKENVSSWVRIENKCSLLGTIIVCSLIIINSLYSLNTSYFVISRLTFFHALASFYLLRQVYSFKSYFLNIKLGVRSLISDSKFFLSGIESVALVFILKYLYFKSYGSPEVESQIQGNIIKLFMISYDLFAALIGLYVRRFIVFNRGDMQSQVKTIHQLIHFVTLLFVLCIALENYFFETGALSVTLFSFLLVAISFPLFQIYNKMSKWFLNASFLTSILVILSVETYISIVSIILLLNVLVFYDRIRYAD